MDEEIRVQIAVIKVQIENMSDQMKRFIAHVESERDVRVEQGKRIDAVQNEIELMNALTDSRTKSFRWSLETVIMIAMLLSNMVMAYAVLVKE